MKEVKICLDSGETPPVVVFESHQKPTVLMAFDKDSNVAFLLHPGVTLRYNSEEQKLYLPNNNSNYNGTIEFDKSRVRPVKITQEVQSPILAEDSTYNPA